MALDFPTSPNIDDTYSFAGRIWRWNGESWVVVTVGLIGATGPTGPEANIPIASYSVTGVASFDSEVFIIGGTGHVHLKTGINSGSVVVLGTSAVFGAGMTGALPGVDGSNLVLVNAKYLEGNPTGLKAGNIAVLEQSNIFGVGGTGALPALDGSKLLEVNAKFLQGKTPTEITNGGTF